jgi:hypothetical protein
MPFSKSVVLKILNPADPLNKTLHNQGPLILLHLNCVYINLNTI